MILGGAEEIGANSCYLNLDGTGILIDAGLHPRRRDDGAFPMLDALEQRPVDTLVVTHAHTDHLGGVPFVMKRFPHLRTLMTYATRDLSHIMLHNGARLLRSDVTSHFPESALELYTKSQIELVRRSFDAVDYGEIRAIRGYAGASDIIISLHWAGHILGSAGVVIENKGLRILHTGDVQYEHQKVIKGSQLPRTHADVVITEATNCADDREIDYRGEAKRLGAFINRITSNNGSVLIPVFALGKTQELLATIHGLMRKGSIPHLPIFTGGMGVSISKVYDQYCYTEPMQIPGFEISDIEQQRLEPRHLTKGAYFKTPSIVLASAGMLNKGSSSFTLATAWMRRKNFGIAFIGYQDPSSPGYQILNSERGTPFDLAGRQVTRHCEIERLRFSAHAALSGLVDHIADVRPSTVVIMHGEPEACDNLGLHLRDRLPGVRLIVPRLGVSYRIAGPSAEDGKGLDDDTAVSGSYPQEV